MVTTQQDSDSKEIVTVATYRPSEYIQAQWPVVRDEPQIQHFVPADFKQVGEAVYEVDAMFADFGAMPKEAIELSRDAGEFELKPAEETPVELEAALEMEAAPEITEEVLISDCSPPISETLVSAGPTESDESVLHTTEEAVDQVGGDTEEPVPSVEQPDDAQAYEQQGAQHELGVVHEDVTEPVGSQVQLDEAKLREALQESYEQGRTDARQEVVEVQLQLEERYRLLWEDMQTQLDEALRLNEIKAVELALQVAKRMVGSVVENQRDYILQVIQEAIKLTAGAEISAIRVSPQDYEFLKLGEYGDKKKVVAGDPISFVSDESIRAGCVLVTTAGEVDFDLDKAWERIRAKALQEPEQ